MVSGDFSWGIATWFEIIGGVLLWLGLGTRLVAFSLLVLTFVATAAVHFPDMWAMWGDLLKGYAVTDMGYGNYKLPLLFTVMLLPLIFNGAGKLSLDHLLALAFKVDTTRAPVSDAYGWTLAALVLGIPFLMLLPKVGFVLVGAALVCFLFGRFARA
jgi:putative oxidoreductase